MIAAIAASWDIAARLVAAHPDFQIFETHPGGGMYDCLKVACTHADIDINREGGLHVHYSPGGEAIPLLSHKQWTGRAAKPAGTSRVTKDVLDFIKVPQELNEDPLPHVLTYRVIARLLASRVFDPHRWDARSQFEDTSGYGGGLRWPVPHVEMAHISANELWVILRDEKPSSWLWKGWAWNARGERLNFKARHRTGAAIDELVAHLTVRPVQPGAPWSLELKNWTGDQPIGHWPSQGS